MKFRLLVPALGLLLGAASCSEDFDVVAPYKPITVVYGVLDATQPVNYVRIQRAYSDPNASALDVAKLPDSSYFANITVSLIEVDTTTAAGTATTVIASAPRVDLATKGFPKDAGTFFNTPNYGYELTYNLNPARKYRLRIRNNDNGNVDSATTTVVPASSFSIEQFTSQAQTFALADGPSTSYSWRIVTQPQRPAAVLEGIVRINYADSSNGQVTRRSFDYRFARSTRNGSSFSTPNLVAPKNDFYAAIGSGMGAAPSGVYRLIDSVDFIAYAGNEELYTFELNQASLGGVAADQIQYRYTNVQGRNTLGIFASRVMQTRLQVPLSNATFEELKKNPATVSANIVGKTSY